MVGDDRHNDKRTRCNSFLEASTSTSQIKYERAAYASATLQTNHSHLSTPSP